MIVITLECPKGVSMKTIFTTLLLLSSFTLYAQGLPASNSDTKARPEAEAPTTTKQEQQDSPGVENTFMNGPYDRKGEYIFFDRLEREQKEAEEEAAEQM